VRRARRLRLLQCALALAGAIAAGSADAAAAAGAIRFTASQMGVPLQGAFGSFVADVDFDPVRPETGSVQVRVAVASVDAGANSANELLRGESFLDAARFPQASFEASEFKARADGQFVATGAFTLKGRRISVPVAFATAAADGERSYDGAFTISRLFFQVGQGEWADTSTLDDTVQVQFHLVQQAHAR